MPELTVVFPPKRASQVTKLSRPRVLKTIESSTSLIFMNPARPATEFDVVLVSSATNP